MSKKITEVVLEQHLNEKPDCKHTFGDIANFILHFKHPSEPGVP